MANPSVENSAPSAPTSRWRLAFIAALLLAVTVGLQYLSGAYHAEFGAEPDEAAHFVTGLCVHDYFAAGCPGNPLHYAQNYYNHYPKVALGHWPPGFYLLQAAWTLPFGASRESVLLLMAVLAAATAFTIFLFLKNALGDFGSLLGALLFLLLPVVRTFSGLVMTEIPITLLSLLAVLAWGKYLERERACDAAIFGALAAMAILTKQSALALAAVPVLTVLFARKLHLLRKFSFWLPAVIVGVLCAPWTLLTYKLASEGAWMQEGWGWRFTSMAIPFYLKKTYLHFGGAIFLGIGALGLVLKLRSREATGKSYDMWVSLAALWASVLLFHMVVPVDLEVRHLIPAQTVAIIFLIAGLVTVLKRFCKLSEGSRAIWCEAVLIGGIFGATGFLLSMPNLLHKGYQGFGAAADAILKNPAAANADILVASDTRGEGMFIAELALREKRPGHTVRRAYKELASSSWSGDVYHAKFSDAAGLMEILRQKKIAFLVLDDSVPAKARKEHHELLSKIFSDADVKGFSLVQKFPIERAGVWSNDGIRVYRVTGAD